MPTNVRDHILHTCAIRIFNDDSLMWFFFRPYSLSVSVDVKNKKKLNINSRIFFLRRSILGTPTVTCMCLIAFLDKYHGSHKS